MWDDRGPLRYLPQLLCRPLESERKKCCVRDRRPSAVAAAAAAAAAAAVAAAAAQSAETMIIRVSTCIALLAVRTVDAWVLSARALVHIHTRTRTQALRTCLRRFHETTLDAEVQARLKTHFETRAAAGSSGGLVGLGGLLANYAAGGSAYSNVCVRRYVVGVVVVCCCCRRCCCCCCCCGRPAGQCTHGICRVRGTRPRQCGQRGCDRWVVCSCSNCCCCSC